MDPLSAGPYIVDAWTLTPSIYSGDHNRCEVGGTFVRVMWSNGLTAYPGGEEVGAAVTASYRSDDRRRSDPGPQRRPDLAQKFRVRGGQLLD